MSIMLVSNCRGGVALVSVDMWLLRGAAGAMG